MSVQDIVYHFEFEDGSQETVELSLNLQTQSIEKNEPVVEAPWAQLDYHKCENCPLPSQEKKLCPLAKNIVNIIVRFENLISYQRIKLRINIGPKQISQETDAQSAVSALMGLLIATSGCPHTEFLKPMAHFHYPLANEEETLFRSVGAHLIGQYLETQKSNSVQINLQKLAANYAELNLVNQGISKRLRTACKADSTLNAIVRLDIFAMIFPEAIEDSLKELEYIFKSQIK